MPKTRPDPEVLLEEFANRPEPKVVDTTALPADVPAAKEAVAGGSEARQKESSRGGACPNDRQDWDAENYKLPGLDLLEEHDSEGRVAPIRRSWRKFSGR